MGDPATPVLPVYEGEPVQMRLIQGAQEAQHVFAMNGTKWLRQPDFAELGLCRRAAAGHLRALRVRR